MNVMEVERILFWILSPKFGSYLSMNIRNANESSEDSIYLVKS
jgi:hypothetical protein